MMKSLIAASIALIFSVSAHAEVGGMIGFTYNFGHDEGSRNYGITAKILSSDREDHPVAGVGVSFYPFAVQKIGVDLSVGYNLENSAVMFGYDILKRDVQFSVGWSNTEFDHD